MAAVERRLRRGTKVGGKGSRAVLSLKNPVMKKPKAVADDAKVTHALENLAMETNKIRLNDKTKPISKCLRNVSKVKSDAAGKPKEKKKKTLNGVKEVKEETEAPMETEVVQQHFLLPRGVDDIDAEDFGDPQMVSENIHFIYSYLRQSEAKHEIRDNFLSGSRVSARMRGILVNWLQEVHLQFKLLQETLYLTVYLLDKYLAIEGSKVKHKNLQLVGVTAMLIACKYEETFIPEVGDFTYITDNTYSVSEILTAELEMLKVLNFELGTPLSINFLRRNSKVAKVDIKHHCLAKYLLEAAMTEYKLASVKPSRTAAAALLLSMKVHSSGQSFADLWTRNIQYYSGYDVVDLRPTATRLSELLLGAEDSKFLAAYVKYQSPSRLNVSRLTKATRVLLQNIVDHPDKCQ